SAEVERWLDLRDGEVLVCALRLGLAALRPVPAPRAPAGPSAAADGAAGVQSPPLSPVLRRIVRFHRRTLLAHAPELALETLTHGGSDFEGLADARHSAAGFAREPLLRAVRERLLAAAERAARASSAALRIVPVALDGAARAAAFAA